MAQQQLFKKIFIGVNEDSDVHGYLKNITDQHPYFGLAHFYKLKNTKLNSTGYNDTAAKTALFFTSNYYLQAQLQIEEPTQFNKTVNDNLLSPSVPEIIKPEVTAIIEEEELVFEPLHSSDYFASQGIKLSEDALGADKLGKQLKSFTSWLKTMKKVHTDKLPSVNTAIETAVKTQAEKSNVEEAIVTEPMAEAYILQKKNVRAIEIYNKLSLLNPAKSAYFAAKIDSLK